MTISLALQFAAAITTLASMWLMGDHKLSGPVFGLVSQIAWAALIFYDELWGLAPVTAAMLLVHSRNFSKWRRDAIVPAERD